MTFLRSLLVLFACLVTLRAESVNSHIRYTGAPIDGGQTCAACHSTFGPANSDSRGSVSIVAGDYNPGLGQIFHVTITHPTAAIWGFQMTARVANDETQEAGMFSPADHVQVRCDDGSPFGSLGPCTGTREFAEHSPALRSSQGSVTFDIPWTPPINEVGDIRLYVSAVAGDNDGTAAGDRAYFAVVTISPTGACTLTAKPALRTAVNAATFQAAFAPNALMTVFGLNFQVPGRTRLAGSGDVTGGQFPTQLACIAVEMNGQRVPISYVQQDQINIQAPALIGSGSVTLAVVANPGRPNELRSDLATLTGLQPTAPGFFTLDGSTIAAQFANTAVTVEDPAVIPGARFAKAGDVVTLYATGLGATAPPFLPGQLASAASTVTAPVSVSVNGAPLAASDIFYAGLSPGSISGLYQINIRVPANVPNGSIPVVATVGGVQTQAGAVLLVRNP
jgi:uncharacterized protein (TIGR03437 family)